MEQIAVRARIFCALIAFALSGLAPAAVHAPLVAAQSDEEGRFESDLFGLTIAWDADWQVIEARERDGVLYMYAVHGDDGIELNVFALPAFGGNEELCLANSERTLLADPRNSNVESGEPPTVGPVTGGESALFEFDFEAEGQRPRAWTLAAWCLELQVGYSVLLMELSAPTASFDSGLKALESIDVETTDNLSAPEFAFEEVRDDLTSFWSQQFDAWGIDPYIAPSYVSFSSPQMTLCGLTNPLDFGWFYCTADNAVYVDMAASDDLTARLGHGVSLFLLAHETGHHIEWLFDILPCQPAECLTGISNMQWELMADCFAGAWMANAADRGVMSELDVEEVLVATADRFSDSEHGTAALRLWWLLQGFHLGPDICFQPEAE